MFPIPQLNQVQHGGAVQERLSTQQRHQLAQKCLTQVVQYKTQEISAQLCILWCSANVFQGCLKRNSFQMPCSPATTKSNTTKWQVWLDKLWWTVILCEICRERSLNETSEKARFEAVPPWFLRSDLTTWIRQATKIASPLARLRTEQCVIVIFFFFLDNKGFLLTYSTDIIENCLFILWRHLDFYFLRCIPSDEERRILAGPPLISSQMRRLHGSVVLLLSFLELTVVPCGTESTAGAHSIYVFFRVWIQLLLW